MLCYSSYAKTVAYSNWVYNNKGFSLDGTDYTVLVSEEGDSILLKTSSGIKGIDLNECLELEYKEFCLNDSAYLQEERDYKAHVYVYYLEPKLEISLTASSSSVTLGDKVTFTATIKNTGDLDSSATFTSDLPEGLRVLNVKNALQNKNTIYWEGVLKKGESRKITYEILVNGELDKYVKASSIYFDGFKNKEIFSSAVRIYTSSLFTFALTSNKEKFEIGEEAVFFALLKNKGEDKMTVNYLTFAFPGYATVKDNSEEKTYLNEFTWKGVIEKNSDINITFRLTPDKQQTYLVSAFGQYNYLGKDYSIESKTKEIKSENKDILINVSSLQATTTLKTGEALAVVVKVKNTNSFMNIQKAWLSVKTKIANFENLSYGVIMPNETVLMLNNEIISPDVSADTEFPVVFNVTYQLENGEIFSETLEKKIRVISEKKLEIVPVLSASSVYEEEPLTITVKLKNSGQDVIKDALVKAIIPKEFTIKGATSGYATLSANQEITLFTLNIYPSIIREEKSFILNFTAAYSKEEKDYLVSSEKTVKILPKKPKVSLTKSVSQTSVYQGQVADVTYILYNEDAAPVYDLILIPSRSQEFDTLNKFNYTISRLNPGEKSTFKLEQIRAKRVGTFSTGSSIVFFNDRIGRKFNSSSGIVNIKVTESKINGALPYLVQETSLASAKVGDEIILALNISNLGPETLTGELEGFGEMSIPKESKQSFQKKLTPEKEGTLIIPPLVFYYDLFSSKGRAYSNQLEIKVVNNTAAPKTDTKKKEEIVNQSTTGEKPVEEKIKKGFFASIFDWFRNLFKKV
jgi:uncharacterized repeat protein (TIGR01451 family)